MTGARKQELSRRHARLVRLVGFLVAAALPPLMWHRAISVVSAGLSFRSRVPQRLDRLRAHRGRAGVLRAGRALDRPGAGQPALSARSQRLCRVGRLALPARLRDRRPGGRRRAPPKSSVPCLRPMLRGRCPASPSHRTRCSRRSTRRSRSTSAWRPTTSRSRWPTRGCSPTARSSPKTTSPRSSGPRRDPGRGRRGPVRDQARRRGRAHGDRAPAHRDRRRRRRQAAHGALAQRPGGHRRGDAGPRPQPHRNSSCSGG